MVRYSYNPLKKKMKEDLHLRPPQFRELSACTQSTFQHCWTRFEVNSLAFLFPLTPTSDKDHQSCHLCIIWQPTIFNNDDAQHTLQVQCAWHRIFVGKPPHVCHNPIIQKLQYIMQPFLKGLHGHTCRYKMPVLFCATLICECCNSTGLHPWKDNYPSLLAIKLTIFSAARKVVQSADTSCYCYSNKEDSHLWESPGSLIYSVELLQLEVCQNT